MAHEAGATAPVADEESTFYWEGLRARRLLVQCCPACGRHRFPPMPACPHCAAVNSSVVDIEPVGSVYSWIVVHRRLTGTAAADVPYVVAVIDLAAGCRIVGRLDTTTAVTAGMPVEGHYLDHGDWTELRFRPVGASA